MALQLRWAGDDDLDRVAEARWLSYSHAGRDLVRYKEGIRADIRPRAGDYLLAERDGAAVGTATSLSMTMWVRGAAIPCQGVAFVGTIKTERRRTPTAGGQDPGVATVIMAEVLAEGRRRGAVISALMPFRVSFYDHFGYGVMERRIEWTLPLTVLPTGTSDGWRLCRESDAPALAKGYQQMVERGQCDIERPEPLWKSAANMNEGMAFVCPGKEGEPMRAWIIASHQFSNGRDLLRVENWGVSSPEIFVELLGFLSTLKDQYYSAWLVAPADWPINRWLKEMQVPHRPVNHPVAETRYITRMQSRILDHKRFLTALHVPADAAGRVDVGVHESERTISRFRAEFGGGRIEAKSASSMQFECSDRIWAAIACGDLPASTAVEMKLAQENEAGAARVLDSLARGPLPFCHEYF